MRSWPEVYLPPAPKFVKHPKLQLLDSYDKSLHSVSGDGTSIYVCGITPYDATHLGHAATYISFDLMHRYLTASGVRVNFCENITDIDDPLLERAIRDNQDWRELAHSQIDLFVSDMTALRVLPPENYQGVVESMSTIIKSVEMYLNKNVAYNIEGDIYLELAKVPGFPGNLPLPLNEAIAVFSERGGDPDRVGKKHPLDPLLWRAKREGEPSWDASFGSGRPGWHVECVAIALANLPMSENTSITIQGGGSDLTFPHHYMTAMQAKVITGMEFAETYVHAGMIGLDGEKMSKSRGNLVFVSKLLEQGIAPEALRMALISQHYQEDRMWSNELLQDAQVFIEKIQKALANTDVAATQPVVQGIVDALADNLNTPRALRILDEWCEASLQGATGGSAGDISRAIDTYLGIAL